MERDDGNTFGRAASSFTFGWYGHLLPCLEACPPIPTMQTSLPVHLQDATGRSTKLLRQSPVKPKVGAGCGSENQNLVNAATLGAQNQWALPSSSTAHQRARFGALDQSTFMTQSCHARGKAANRFSFPQPERQSEPVVDHPGYSGNTSRTPAFNRFRMSPIFPNVTLCSPVSSRNNVEAEMPSWRANTA